jgi:hypothetical protein
MICKGLKAKSFATVLFAKKPRRFAKMANSDILEKYASEDIIFTFDFRNKPEVVTGDTLNDLIAPVFKATPADLTFAAPAFDALKQQVQIRISGGVQDVFYEISCRVTTDTGRLLEICGQLVVLGC